MKKTVLRVAVTLPLLIFFLLALTKSQATVSMHGSGSVEKTELPVAAQTPAYSLSRVVLKHDTTARTRPEIAQENVQAEVRFAAPASLKEALKVAQQRGLYVAGIQHSFYIGDQLFTGYYSVPPDSRPDQIRSGLLSEHKLFLQNLITSIENPKEPFKAEERETLQTMGFLSRQALDDADSAELKVEALTVERSPSALEETKSASPSVMSVDVTEEQQAEDLLPETLLNSQQGAQVAGGGGSSNWVPATGKITIGSESRRSRYVLVQMRWDDVSGFNFFSTFEPDFYLNNSEDSDLGRGTYLSRKEKFLRIPDVEYWSSNLPTPYLDTRLRDPRVEVTYTIGSAYANGIKTKNWYINYIRTKNGDANRDNARFSVQRGNRRPFWCYSTFCSYASETVQIFRAWDIPVPGVAFW